ncbi:hypothetical protein GQ53DRAFT_811274 [Thozetella sp. PMI_491]|nr:hypothetical protein GQ53DRAFT_811274 [Thozetella sp. PMI_491]
MELPFRLPVLPSQCSSPSSSRAPTPQHSYHQVESTTARHGHGIPNGVGRQPLQESTGNAQHNIFAALRSSYAPRLDALSSLSSAVTSSMAAVSNTIPTPPVVPTQALGSSYAMSLQHQRNRPQLAQRRRKRGINPICLSPQYQNYRNRQQNKEDQKWPDSLEEPFLDALLLIPHMGRKKFTMRDRRTGEMKQYGRNMLIGEYLWLACKANLPPGFDMSQLERGRKQVSSHIQVLKNFFLPHKCFHVFFPSQENKKQTAETQSFKNHPVLIALAEGRLPDEKPNYEYFAQILALNDQVTVKPKRSWIFVSHRDYSVGEDGHAHHAVTGETLSQDEYPHLARNQERETWPRDEQQIVRGTILHEFTKTVQQGESRSVKEVAAEWEGPFPELHTRVEAVAANDARCEFLHMHVTLELQGGRRYPSQSELNSWIDISVEQPHLHSHQWKVTTRLARPTELADSEADTLWEKTDEVEYSHRRGCPEASRASSQRRQCDCARDCRRETVSVPFPAPVWARTFSNCAEYPPHKLAGPGPTQMDLVGQIAMLQEIWSSPPDAHDNHLFGSEGTQTVNPRWTRRAMLLWTFETVHSFDDKGVLHTAEHGKTTWRFLTALDPTSQSHQQQALLSATAAARGAGRGRAPSHPSSADGMALSRGSSVLSPNQSYPPQLGAAMGEGFGTGWEAGMGALSSAAASAYAHHHSTLAHTHPAISAPSSVGGLGAFDGFGGESLATPPPTASLSGSFSHTMHDSGHGDLGYLGMTTTTVGVDTEHSLGSLAAVTDPFLAGASTSSLDIYNQGQDYSHGQDQLSGWDAHSLDGGWSAGYAGSASSQHGSLDWHSMPKTSVAQHDWSATTATTGAEERDLWATATGTVTPNTTPTPDVVDQYLPTGGAGRPEHEVQDNQEWVLVPGGSAPQNTNTQLSQDWEDIVLPRATSHKRKPSDLGYSGSPLKHGAHGGAPPAKRQKGESDSDRENYPASTMKMHRGSAAPVADMEGRNIEIKEEWS